MTRAIDAMKKLHSFWIVPVLLGLFGSIIAEEPLAQTDLRIDPDMSQEDRMHLATKSLA